MAIRLLSSENITGNITVSGTGTFAGNVTLSGQAAPQLFLDSNTAGTPNYTLIANASSQFIIGRAGVSNDFILNSGNATFAGNVTVGNNGNINIPTASSGNANLNFDGTDFKITSNSSSANLKLETNSTTRLTINSSGNATFAGDITLNDDLNFSTNGFADISNTGTGAMRFKPSSQTLALTLTGANATFAGTITSGALSVGTSGTSRFTDTNAYPLQLNRGLAVDVVGAAGTILGIGTYSTGTTYIDATRIIGVLEADGVNGDLYLQVLNSGTHTTALTLNNDTNATFAGDVTVGALTTGQTAQLVVNHDGGSSPVAKFMSRTNKSIVQISDNDTTGYVSAENGLFSIGRAAGVNAANININGSNSVGIGTSSPLSKFEVYGGNSGVNDVDRYVRFKASNGEKRFDFHIGGTGNASRLSMFAADGTTEGARISSSGDSWLTNNVGIGTDTPDTKLMVSGEILSENTSGGYFISTRVPSGSARPTLNFYGTALDINYVTGYAGGGASTAITILSGGNVGIGTTNPTNYKLEVNGNVKGASFGTDESTTARIFAPSGAAYNGSGGQTGYLILKLPDLAASGVNNMMSGVIRVFDYAVEQSFDVHFAGYWYSGFNWTNCTAWIDSQSNQDRNFTVRFGVMNGASGSADRATITIGEGNSTWSYCKFSVIEYTSGHSNMNLYKWNSGWGADLSSTYPGTVIRSISNTQINNWTRNGQDLYYGSGTGNVGIGTTLPSRKLDVRTDDGVLIKGASGSTNAKLSFVPASGGRQWDFQNNSSNFQIKDESAGITRMFFHYNGRLAIGSNLTDPLGQVDVYRAAGQSGTCAIAIRTGEANNRSWGLSSEVRKTGDFAILCSPSANTAPAPTDDNIRLYLQSGGDISMAMQDYNANPSATNYGLQLETGALGKSYWQSAVNAATSHYHYEFINTNGQVGTIRTQNSSTSYVTTSDYRLKEDLQNFEGLEMVSRIPVYDFKWKVDDTRSYGVIAHELEEVLPDAVSGDKDLINEDGSINPQGVDYSKIVPVLVKAIQELKAEIEQLKTQIK